ncbi:MAG: hypothetical protein AABM66_09800 [Actinomycetota bacterium]
MPQRHLIIAWIAGFLAGAPVVVLGTLFDWPAISFFGAVLLFGIVFFSLFDRMERNPGRHSRRSV